jgi:hypothetical protein
VICARKREYPRAKRNHVEDEPVKPTKLEHLVPLAVVPLLGAPLLGLVNGGSLPDLLVAPHGRGLGLGLGPGMLPLPFGDSLGDGLGVAELLVVVEVNVAVGNRLGDSRSESLSGEEGDNGGKSELHFEVSEG